jgi:hypothetical protein
VERLALQLFDTGGFDDFSRVHDGRSRAHLDDYRKIVRYQDKSGPILEREINHQT